MIRISPEFTKRWPYMKLGCIECEVTIDPQNAELWKKIEHLSGAISISLEIEEISQLPVIQATRKAYKACGKDPARYRPSAESLLRRIARGDELYQINNVVDTVNLISAKSGFSIGGYDTDWIEGNIELGIGNENEAYEGIGRGELNIDRLPVLRDAIGPFGSPTSDSVRTSVNERTKNFLMVIFGFGEFEKMQNAMEMAIDHLFKYCSAENLRHFIVNPHE